MRSKWLVGGLIVSLVFNLLLGGFIIGRMSGAGMPGMGPDPTMGLHRLLRFLPDERRRELLTDMHSQRSAMRPRLEEIRATQQGIGAAVAAEDFDREALINALAAFRSHLETTQARSHETFITIVEGLTPEERIRLAKAMRRGRGAGRGGPRGRP